MTTLLVPFLICGTRKEITKTCLEVGSDREHIFFKSVIGGDAYQIHQVAVRQQKELLERRIRAGDDVKKRMRPALHRAQKPPPIRL